MNTKERIVYNILKRLDEMNNSDEFKKKCPGIKAEEFLYIKVRSHIKLKRLASILNNNAKVIRTEELYYISKALNISLSKLIEIKNN